MTTSQGMLRSDRRVSDRRVKQIFYFGTERRRTLRRVRGERRSKPRLRMIDLEQLDTSA